MMKKKIVFILLLLFSVGIEAQNVKVFESKGKLGMKDKNDKVILKPHYTEIEPLNDNYFLTKVAYKAGVVTKSGRVVFPTIYDEVSLFADDYFLVKENNKYGLIDQFNKTILPLQYDGLKKMNDFLFVVKSKNKEGVLSKFGNLLIPVQYDHIDVISEDVCSIELNNKKGIMDKQGNIVLAPSYDKIEEIPNQKMYKVIVDDHLGLVSLGGKVLAEPIFDEIDDSSGNYVLLKKGNKFGFLINGSYIPAEYDKILYTQLDLGVICVRNGKLNGFITTDGKVVPARYENISRFSPSGLAFVEKDGKLMFVDLKGIEHTLQEVNVVSPK